MRRGPLAATWALAAIVVIAAWSLGAFRAAEREVADNHFSLGGADRPDPSLVMVLIDDATLQAEKHYPLPRRLHAMMIDRLKRDGARVIVEDVVFAEQGPSVAQDNQLLRAIRRAGNVVLAAAETDHGLPGVLGGHPAAFHATAGNSGFKLDHGGVYRRVSASIDGLQTLPVAVARRLGAHVDDSAFPSGGALIDYAAPHRHYKGYSFDEVLHGRVPASAFRGRTVIVGAGEPTLGDTHPTPTSAEMNGPEVEANAIATVLRGLPLHKGPGWLDLLAILALAAVTPLAAARRSPRVAILAAGAAAVTYLLASQLAFALGLEIALVAPLTALVLSLPFTILIAYIGASHRLELDAERHLVEMSEGRARAVEMADEARRRVERDLHDGAQQQLVAIVFELGAARLRLRESVSPEVDSLLQSTAGRVNDAVASLRDLAHGAYPGALIEGGLDAGLSYLVEQLPRSVRLSGRVGRRLDENLEAVGYFFASETLANALKHAESSRIDVTVKADDERLFVEVRDDGRGGANPQGTGLIGLSERAAAYGGTVTVTGPPSGGTSVTLELPLGDQDRWGSVTPGSSPVADR